VNDQLGAPTWSRLIAEATAQILAQGKGNLISHLEQVRGLYHHHRERRDQLVRLR
jgi:dTDP-4-dehydrorhamnose reductase